MAHSKETLIREARRRGLLENEDITAMQGLAEVGRGALGEFADVARSGIGAGIETVAEDVAPSIGRGLSMAAGGMGATDQTMNPEVQEETFGDRYESYKRMADAEREYVALANPELSSTLRNVGMGLGVVAGGGVAGMAAKGLTRATKAALSKGASKVAPAAAKRRGASRVPPAAPKAGGKLGGVKEGAMLGVAMDASDGDISLESAATSAAGGALGGKVVGGILGKLGITGAQAEAIKGAAINTPIGRMGISQLAKKFGLSGTKAAALWYALHPTSRRGLSKLRDSLKGK